VRVLVAGCGYVGTALAARVAAHGDEVTGVRRSPVAIHGVRTIAADLLAAEPPPGLPDPIDALVYAVSADAGDEASYRAAYVRAPVRLLEHLRDSGRGPARVVYVSSTGVYGQADGEWVDEASPAEPAHATGRILLEGEHAARGAATTAVVLRLGGIYGPGRTRVIDSVRRGEATRAAHPVWTNRIHRDDAARAIAHLLDLREPESLYLGVDREPADQADVLGWIAERLGLPAPPPSARPSRDPRYERSNKRCRSDRLVASGFRFHYPTYREGYGALIAETEEA
jgi:nucleoside-diphosphate-sugar epimerase